MFENAYKTTQIAIRVKMHAITSDPEFFILNTLSWSINISEGWK